ncbi:AraC family transcriptional regulator [Amycolatopsis rhizosphaerae]|uniref:AraC family transcriptional regulator n=1 Tax=Amycolatopsis rhizosphaerae TaxID=2053003 RepID=A0A558BLU0_9PSEU|nr:AraC family transcriptional regulator [Amycolatopsis rhizosphaerae]TVT37482.1 AraC family transcriptional regulator [Amycolatopsis rhizosphaerae]
MFEADTAMRVPAGRRRGVASVALLTRIAGENGMAARRCLHGTGLTLEHLADPDIEIDSEQELLVVGNVVAELAAVPGLGLQAGRRYHLTSYGQLGFAAISSATLGQAIEVGLNYLDLTFTFMPFVIHQSPHGIRAVLGEQTLSAATPAEVVRFLVERDVAAIVTFVRDLVGTQRAIARVGFRHPEPSYAALYPRLLGVVPSFGGPATEGVIPAEALRMPLPQAEPRTAELMRRHCEQRRRRLRAPARTEAGTSETVRSRLRRELERGRGLADQRRVAEALGVSERSVRRALGAEGTTFATLTAEVASEFAEELLADGHTVESVAAALGYAHASSFSHAFKRWTGYTPGAGAGRVPGRNCSPT